jgi:rhodanese-related sulfurtransferase
MVTEIDRKELKQKLDHPKKSLLVEALPADQFRNLHLPGALSMPVDQVRSLATELLPNKDVEVIVYCAGPTCHASSDVAKDLDALGYTNVRHYVGGKQDWIKAGLPVVRSGEPRAAA